MSKSQVKEPVPSGCSSDFFTFPSESEISAHAEEILSLSETVPLIFIKPFTQFSFSPFERSDETSISAVGSFLSSVTEIESIPFVSVSPVTVIVYLYAESRGGFVPSMEIPSALCQNPFDASISNETEGLSPRVPFTLRESLLFQAESIFLIVPRNLFFSRVS